MALKRARFGFDTMPGHEDISWQVLRQIVRDWAGASAELAEVTPLHGGCVSTTLALTTKDNQKAVLKVTPHRVDRSFADEQVQLGLLRGLGVPVPQVYACQIGTLDSPVSYLLMEFVEGVELNTARASCEPEHFDALQEEIADLVLKLHAHTAPHYRRVTSAESPAFESWPRFYRSVYDGIWHEVEKSNVLPTKGRKQIARLHERLDRLLAHDDRPRLVHWDIWSTNILVKTDPATGRPRVSALLDPNCKFAHAEAEIAYLELFHTVTPPFLKAYQQVYKLGNDYHQVRKPIYQLYELINHVCVFGQEYLKPLMAALDRTSRFV
jgi:fructosamine-3-kinase